MSANSIAIPEKPKRRVGVIFTGMALFSMFFGAGNLIFPLIVGRSAGTETPSALFGLAISAVAFPFLGLIAMMMYRGDIRSFLGRLGKGPAFALLFLLQIAQGPMGSLPRLVTLMHASLKAYFPNFTLLFFSVLICAVIFLLTYRPQRIVALLGVVLTPLFILSLAILFGVGAINAPEANVVAESSSHFFFEGLTGGYQTMDLIAALLFATVIMPHLSHDTDALSREEADWVIKKRMKGASMIAAGLLMITYVGLCWISSHYSWTLDGAVAPEDLLGAIAEKILGPWGLFISAAAIFLACLTTAISLAAVFSDYLQKDLLKGRVSPNGSLAITLGVTAAMANLGFSGIVKLMSPLLEILYPGLIALCIVNIAYSLYRVKTVKAPVFFVLGFAAGGSCFG